MLLNLIMRKDKGGKKSKQITLNNHKSQHHPDTSKAPTNGKLRRSNSGITATKGLVPDTHKSIMIHQEVNLFKATSILLSQN